MDITKTALRYNVYRILGAEPSPFTAKIRAYLKYKNIPFKEVIASEVVYKELILPLTNVSFIPVLLVYDASISDNEIHDVSPLLAIQDTKVIMDYFEAMNQDLLVGNNGFMTHPVIPHYPQLAFASMILELLGDEWLINQAIYWRWGKGNFEQQREFLAFDYGSFAKGGLLRYDETFKNGEQKLLRLRRVLPLLGVDDKTSPAFRRQFMQLLKLMSSHFSHHPFLLGSRISVADFAFFGSFYAHLGRDPVPSSIIKTDAPLVWEWIERVGGGVRWGGAGIDRWDSNSQKWMASYGEIKYSAQSQINEMDIVPASSSEIVALLLADYVTVLKTTVDRTLQYLNIKTSASRGKDLGGVTVKLPRTLGRHFFSVGSAEGEGVLGERNVYTHSIWMLDRIIGRAYSSDEQRSAGDEWLGSLAIQRVLHEWKYCVTSWSKSQWKVDREQNELVARKQFISPRSNL